MSFTDPKRLGVFLAIAAAFGFSFKAIFIKLAYPHGVDAVTLLALRMAFCLPVFLWVGLNTGRGAPELSRGDILRIMALGTLGFYGASVLDFIGLQYISAGLERLILFTYPMLTLLIGLAWQKRPISRRELLAMGLCYTGITAAFAHDLKLSTDATTVWIGAGFAFASSVSFAFYLSGSGSMIQKLGSVRFTALAMLASTAVTLGHFAATHPLEALVLPWQVYGWVLAMAVLSTVLPVFAQSAAIRHIGGGQTALIGMIGPLLTLVFAAGLLDEPFSTYQLLGTLLVVGGVYVVSARPVGRA